MSSLPVAIFQQLLSHPKIQRLRDLVVLVAVLRFGGDIYHALSELGLIGCIRTLVMYPIIATWTFAKKNVSFVRGQLQGELDKSLRSIEHSMLKEQLASDFNNFTTLPENKMAADEILEELQKYKELGHINHQEGKISGCVYNGGPELTKLVSAASNLFEWSNPLHPDVFPGLRKIESEAISMVVSMFNGTAIGAVGSMTSGGTESIMMAIRTHKEWARDVKGITRPNIVAPVTIHPAFDKGCEYFGIRIVHVPVDPKTMKADIGAMRKAITSNTIMLAGSCPSYPWGLVDDIEALGKLAQQYKIGLHVDCCLGGFLVAFMDKAGYPLPLFDFRVPGVTSISCDTHKYGFAPKGTSVVMYRSHELRRYQYFSAPNWPGGIYASPTMAGSRPGQIVAGCWAALMYFGKQGYVDTTKTIIGHAREIYENTRNIPGIQVIGDPKVSVIAYQSDVVDIYRVSAKMVERKWNLNMLQYPPSFHICCVYPTNAKLFVKDLKEVMEEVMKNPKEKATGSAAIYGMAASVPDRSIIAEVSKGYIDTLYKVVTNDERPHS